MNLLLVAGDEIDSEGLVRLDDRRAEHLRKVLKVEPGKPLRVGRIGGGIGRGEVRAVEGERVLLAVDIPDRRPWVSRIDLVVALPRPQALHRLLQTAATMGVGRLDLVNAWRVEKSFFSSPSLRPETVRRHLLLGAEQGGTTHVPEVGIHPRLVPFVESLGPGGDALRLLAHPGEQPALAEIFDHDAEGRIRVAVGPEGGWIDREVETWGGAGFRPVQLGPWILKVENAVTAVLAQLDLLERGVATSPGQATAPPSSPPGVDPAC